MAENLGTGVSYVSDVAGYAYDEVVFQKGKPPLDSELNLAQEIRQELGRRSLNALPSGWLTFRPYNTNPLLKNQFYTQDPSTAIPEYALVNGMPIFVTNTGSQQDNVNIVDLGTPPTTGNAVNGVYLEVWRALLNGTNDNNRPQSTTAIDSIMDIEATDINHSWAVGENGLILATTSAGSSWTVQPIDTKRKLNSASFINNTIGWVVGENGTIARTASGGQSWTMLSSGLTENLTGVFAVSQLIVWAVGTSGTILKSSNGINFVPQTSGVTFDLSAVYFYDSLIGWAVGKSGTILKTTDGGSTWRQLVSGTVNDLSSVFFYDTNFGFAVGKSGTLLRSSDGGATWVSQSSNVFDNSNNHITVSVDYTDVTMTPSLDQYVDGEDDSSQFSGSNKNFTTMNVPITKGDGHGTVTTNPTDVIVKVNDVAVGIDSVNGTTGQIILSAAPRHCDHVKVYYWYRIDSSIFRGVAFVTGKTGTVLRSSDIGQKWVKQNPNTSYDLNAVSFIDNNAGWVAGQFSTVRYTINSGATWNTQTSDVLIRHIQRVFNEGNTGTAIYLTDNIIHPDANIETTERVQIQYNIRVAPNVDPFNYPDSGLGSQAVTGLGPNATGSFAFENMGPVTGDYGLYRAKCPNTVDGYCWAIPMAFVSRRNTTAYNVTSNTNGQYVANSAIRPDLLVATDVVEADILDVRRRIVLPSIDELLNANFEKLLNNDLRTRFARNTDGGDRYGSELLQLDRIGGDTSDGGQDLGMTLNDFFPKGQISSGVTIESVTYPDVLIAPTTHTATYEGFADLTSQGKIYHYNPAHYKAFYNSANPSFNGKPVPGYFVGLGTSKLKFVYASTTNTNPGADTQLVSYVFIVKTININSISLTNVPTTPQLVKNFSKNGAQAFYYRGVLADSSGQIIEEWDSGIPGNLNYAFAIPGKEVSDSSIVDKASTVELHYFMTLATASAVGQVGIDPGDPTKLLVDPSKFGPSTTSPYVIYTISKINNIAGEFSYKLKNTIVAPTLVTISTITGYSFVPGTIIEIIGMVQSDSGDFSVRNGATVNFSPPQKSFGTFCRSEVHEISIPAGSSSVNVTALDGNIIGVSTAETATSLTQQIAWLTLNTGLEPQFYPVMVTVFDSDTITVNFPPTPGIIPIPGALINAKVTIQILVKNTSLPNNDNTSGEDGVLIGYYYAPLQTESELPGSLTVSMVTKPVVMNVSDLGTGGSLLDAEPYSNPLINIPIADITITNDNSFYNIETLKFSNFSVTGGFVQLPVYVPGNFQGDLVFSAPLSDNMLRRFYSAVSNNFSFSSEGLLMGSPRKNFVGAIGRIAEAADTRFVRGEYVLIVMSTTAYMGTENKIETGQSCAVAIYRLPNKPLSRI